ncbi:ABC transporter permease [Nocardioides lentus]|uniref:ABC transporter permease n=1 Tax=Nocardioides lentus TaxID=338077 RepID=A0ABN2PHE5_9ACTN
MSSTDTSAGTSAGTARSGARSTSYARVRGLAAANLKLQLRNRLTAAYALVLPLLPLALLLTGDRGDDTAVLFGVNYALILVMMFPAYYNLLSATVTRRDELVLKRLRTGETTDAELLASLALPGAGIGLALAVLAVPVAMALGAPFPTNPVLYLLGVAVSLVLFAALAFWTAAWTRNAEAAQMTSLPVIMLAVVGGMGELLPERAARLVELTPGAALEQVVAVGWIGRTPDLTGTVDFAQSWAQAGQPLLVMAVWTALALVLARRSMRWEPRH